LGPEEKMVWQGTPSQIKNLKTYILCALFFWLIIPIFIAIKKWMQLKCTKFEVTTQRIRLSTGIFSKISDEVELYRVKDVTLVEPFFLRMFSLGNVVLVTSDRTHPIIVIPAIPNAKKLREQLRTHIEKVREKKLVREVDFE